MMPEPIFTFMPGIISGPGFSCNLVGVPVANKNAIETSKNRIIRRIDMANLLTGKFYKFIVSIILEERKTSRDIKNLVD